MIWAEGRQLGRELLLQLPAFVEQFAVVQDSLFG
jgi:hypothetical protein